MSTVLPALLANPLILAPMAGYSDVPFRLLCRSHGAGLCVSEMISCHGLVYHQRRTLQLASAPPEDRPLSLQLFGSEPAMMGEAAAILDSLDPDLIDINMGCPVKKVTRRGAGAALMGDPQLSKSILCRVIESCSCPVTVKIRSGIDHRHLNAVTFARMLEDAGAAAVTVHGRTWKQAFSGHADWSVVRSVAEALQIPVVGNGDLNDHQDALEKQRLFGCAAVMIGRAALGNPWIFQPAGKPRSSSLVARGALSHMELVELHLDHPERVLGALKNHLGRYFKGFPGAAALRKEIYAQSSWPALKTLLDQLTITAGGTRPHPNLPAGAGLTIT